MKILRVMWKIVEWMVILTPVVIGGGCTILGGTALFEGDPTIEQVTADCRSRIVNGDYEMFAATERLDACLEDGFKSMGGAEVFGLAIAFVGLLTLMAGLAWVRHALRPANTNASL